MLRKTEGWLFFLILLLLPAGFVLRYYSNDHHTVITVPKEKNTPATAPPLPDPSLALIRQFTDRYHPPFASFATPFTHYRVNTKRDTVLYHPGGSSLHIPIEAFVDSVNNTTPEEVDIYYREFHDAVDLYANGIPLYAPFKPFFTFEIYAHPKDQLLMLTPKKSSSVVLSYITPALVGDQSYEGYNKHLWNLSEQGWKNTSVEVNISDNVFQMVAHPKQCPELEIMEGIYWKLSSMGETIKTEEIFKNPWQKVRLTYSSQNKYLLELESFYAHVSPIDLSHTDNIIQETLPEIRSLNNKEIENGTIVKLKLRIEPIIPPGMSFETVFKLYQQMSRQKNKFLLSEDHKKLENWKAEYQKRASTPYLKQAALAQTQNYHLQSLPINQTGLLTFTPDLDADNNFREKADFYDLQSNPISELSGDPNAIRAFLVSGYDTQVTLRTDNPDYQQTSILRKWLPQLRQAFPIALMDKTTVWALLGNGKVVYATPEKHTNDNGNKAYYFHLYPRDIFMLSHFRELVKIPSPLPVLRESNRRRLRFTDEEAIQSPVGHKSY